MDESVSVKLEEEECESGRVPERLAAAFGLLQEKWALSIIYVLLGGPAGFNCMARGAGSVNPTTLAQRLVRMEQAGLVTKTVQSTMPPRTSYELTEAGAALRPVMEAMCAWSARYGHTCTKCPDTEQKTGC